MEESKNVELALLGYLREAEQAKFSRMEKNKINFETYHQEMDWSHKQKGQSQEFLPRLFISVEQLTASVTQGLLDTEKWFTTNTERGVNEAMNELDDDDVWALVDWQLRDMEFYQIISDSIKLGFLGSLAILKPVLKDKRQLERIVEDDEGIKKEYKVSKKVSFTTPRQEDFYPDPTGAGLYVIERIEIDHHRLVEMAENKPDRFIMENVENVASHEKEDSKAEKSRETGQDIANENTRKRVEIYDFYGTIVEPQTGKVLHKDVHAIFDAEGKLLCKPGSTPMWECVSPYVAEPIIRVPNSVWHVALADAPARLNLAINELFNLQLDSGLMAVHGIKQIREDWLEDPEEVADGVMAGMTIRANSSTPQQGKVIERVDTGGMTQEGQNTMISLDREYSMSALTNDLRMGTLPQRAVKATEVVASNESINNVFSNVAKTLDGYVSTAVEYVWKNMCQNFNELDLQKVRSILGEDKFTSLLGQTNAEIYTKYVIGRRFNVFGISGAINKIEDFKKYTTVLQTIAAAPVLAENFGKEYSFSSLLKEIIKSLQIDPAKIKASEAEKAEAQKEQELRRQAEQQRAQGGQGSPDGMSQVGSAANTGEEDMLNQVRATNISGNGEQ